MLRVILLLFTIQSFLYSLELSISSAKDSGEPYSILSIKNSQKFLCQENKNEFEDVISVVCAFDKKPQQELPRLSNIFFQIEPKVKDKTFFLIIKPTKKVKLYPIAFDLITDNVIYKSKVELSSSWVVIGYSDKIPFIKNQESGYKNSLNFPITFANQDLPYIGSLDLKGEPIHSERLQDVSEYVKIKESYDIKQYESTLSLIKEAMNDYPTSLFMPELLYYKIKTEDKLALYDNLIDDANTFLRKFASDENVAEVLSLLAKAYDKDEQRSDAQYFYDRLFSEHPDSIYTKWANIYLAQNYYENAQYQKASQTLQNLLEQTDDIDVGVNAGFYLVKSLMASAKYKDAKKYAQKILKLKPTIYNQNFLQSFDMLNNFAENEYWDIAAEIAKVLLNSKETYPDYYEELLKNCGIWLSKSDDKKGSQGYLDRYLAEFGDGIYSEDVKVAKDRLFFELDGIEDKEKLTQYDKLIDEYSGNSIADKALYEKAKLLNKEGKFSDVLALENELKTLDDALYEGVDEIIKTAAIGSMQNSLKDKECLNVLSISSKYGIELSDEWDDGVYECAMRGADFELAKKISSKNIASKDIQVREKWLHRYIEVEFATGNYSDVLGASKDLLALIEDDKDSKYKDVYRYIFDTYQRLENYEKMIESIVNIDETFNTSYEDVARFASIVTIASLKNDDNLVINYAQKVLNIQKNSTLRAYTPEVEFALYDAYTNKKEYKKALQVMTSLDDFELNKIQRSKQKYYLGNAYTKLWRDGDAKIAYDEAIKADDSSPWAKLAKDASGL